MVTINNSDKCIYNNIILKGIHSLNIEIIILVLVSIYLKHVKVKKKYVLSKQLKNMKFVYKNSILIYCSSGPL